MTRRTTATRRAIRSSTVALASCVLAAACSLPGQSAGTGEPSGPGTDAPSDAAGEGGATSTPSPTGPSSTEGAVITPDDTTGDGGGGTEDDGGADPPPFYANTAPDFGEPSGGAVGVLTDIRMGAHEGFDRAVLEFAGSGTPGWHVRYVDESVGDPSGMPVRVDGSSVLEVTVDGVAYPVDEAAGYDGPGRVRIQDAQVVKELVFSSIFEGRLQAFVGVDDGELPFRVYSLAEPTRVVIEVQTP